MFFLFSSNYLNSKSFFFKEKRFITFTKINKEIVENNFEFFDEKLFLNQYRKYRKNLDINIKNNDVCLKQMPFIFYIIPDFYFYNKFFMVIILILIIINIYFNELIKEKNLKAYKLYLKIININFLFIFLIFYFFLVMHPYSIMYILDYLFSEPSLVDVFFIFFCLSDFIQGIYIFFILIILLYMLFIIYVYIYIYRNNNVNIFFKIFFFIIIFFLIYFLSYIIFIIFIF